MWSRMWSVVKWLASGPRRKQSLRSISYDEAPRAFAGLTRSWNFFFYMRRAMNDLPSKEQSVRAHPIQHAKDQRRLFHAYCFPFLHPVKGARGIC